MSCYKTTRAGATVPLPCIGSGRQQHADDQVDDIAAALHDVRCGAPGVTVVSWTSEARSRLGFVVRTFPLAMWMSATVLCVSRSNVWLGSA
jgi:hypothetical protein